MEPEYVFAEDIQEGDYLTDLGNGYVVDVEGADNAFSLHSGRIYQAIGDAMTAITFHDENGEENYLILVNSFPIRVERGRD